MEKDKMLKIYNKEHIENGLSYKKIQEKYNIERGTWTYYAQKYNLKYDGRKYRCNDEYFDVIDSSDKAYILGFLYADGYISNDGRIGMLLNEKDIEVMTFILNKLCPAKTIKNYNNQSIKRDPQIKFRITSEVLYNRLLELGFCIDKTNTDSNILNNILKDFKKDFIRGYLDGDGNIRCQHLNNESYSIAVSICNGSIQILKDIEKYFSNLNIRFAKIKTYSNKSEYYTLSYYRKTEVSKICEHIYDNDGFALERKKHNALKIIKICSNTEVTI